MLSAGWLPLKCPSGPLNLSPETAAPAMGAATPLSQMCVWSHQFPLISNLRHLEDEFSGCFALAYVMFVQHTFIFNISRTLSCSPILNIRLRNLKNGLTQIKYAGERCYLGNSSAIMDTLNRAMVLECNR